MHILVTDRLACGRCGPGFGLILMADELEDRRVLAGALGCPNCRERYPIEGGFGDLRPSPRTSLGGGAVSPDDEAPAEEEVDGPEAGEGERSGSEVEAALRLAAFLGVERGPGMILLVGPPARHAERIARMIDDIEVVAARPELRRAGEVAGVSRVAVASPFPFQSAAFRGVALAGETGAARVPGAIRLLVPGARLVLMAPPPGAARAMEEAGLELLLEAKQAVVAARK